MSGTIGNKIIKLISIDSTNNYATKHYSNENWSEGTIVQASYQENGRGQIKNSWESKKGDNLLVSVLFYPTFLPINFQFLLSKVVSLSVHDVVSSFVPNVAIKWPNDIYIGSKKVAGILIDNSIMGSSLNSSIAGIGLNINQQTFVSGAPNPVSLVQITKVVVDIEMVLEMLIERLNYWYDLLKRKEVGCIDKEYLDRLYQIDTYCLYCDDKGEFTGRILGVNQIGQLVVEKENGEIHEYHFKKIQFL